MSARRRARCKRARRTDAKESIHRRTDHHGPATGPAVETICRKLGISEASFYRWKKRYGSLGVPEIRELRQLRDENKKLKGLVADLSLDKTILQEALQKNGEACAAARAGRAGARRISALRTPRLSGRGAARSSVRCRSVRGDQAALRRRLRELAGVRVLSRASRERGQLPQRIHVDNGTEFTSRALDHWAYCNHVALDFSRPGKPVDNAFVEAFNATLRRECLSQH